MTDVDILHPSMMYQVRAWKRPPVPTPHYPFRFRPVFQDAVVDLSHLPPIYTAMKFYDGDCLPPSTLPALRTFVARMAQQTPVVMLDTGLPLQDGHADYTFDDIPNVMSARDGMPWQINLGAQAQIIAGAQAFIGPCGGITWLAPRLGVDVTALCVPNAPHAAMHIRHAQSAYQGSGTFRVTDPVSLAS